MPATSRVPGGATARADSRRDTATDVLQPVVRRRPPRSRKVARGLAVVLALLVLAGLAGVEPTTPPRSAVRSPALQDALIAGRGGSADHVARPPRGTVDRFRALGVVLIALGFGVATSALVGPLVLGQMQYRTSATALNQLLGGDAASLFVVAPLALVAGVLALRRHPVAPLLALGPALYVIYLFAQVVIGQEYLRLPGNVELFFPLLLAVFVLGEAAVVLAWGACLPTCRCSRTGWSGLPERR